MGISWDQQTNSMGILFYWFWFLVITKQLSEKHATYDRNINAYGRRVYLQVDILLGRKVIIFVTLESNILVKVHLTKISCYT